MLGRTALHFPPPLSCLAPPPAQAKLHHYYRRGEAKTSATGRYGAGPGCWNDTKHRSATTGRKAGNLLPNPNHLHTAQSPCHTGEWKERWESIRLEPGRMGPVEEPGWTRSIKECPRHLHPRHKPHTELQAKATFPWGRGRSTGRAPP